MRSTPDRTNGPKLVHRSNAKTRLGKQTSWVYHSDIRSSCKKHSERTDSHMSMLLGQTQNDPQHVPRIVKQALHASLCDQILQAEADTLGTEVRV